MVINHINKSFIVSPETSEEVKKLKELLGHSLSVSSLEPVGSVGLHPADQNQHKDDKHQ